MFNENIEYEIQSTYVSTSSSLLHTQISVTFTFIYVM